MQDIAEARIVVPDLPIQDGVLEQLINAYPSDARRGVRVKDSRETGDALGYRAIHLIADLSGTPGEIQIRTGLQQFWAQTIEEVDRQRGTDLKHGVGPKELQRWLLDLSHVLRTFDLENRFEESELPFPPEVIE